MSDLMITTYSMWRQFRNCRKACELRYFKELVPLAKDVNLVFGSLVHDCLELWHSDRNLSKVYDHLDKVCCNRNQDEKQKADWQLATAMLTGYAETYSKENFEIIALEKTFSGPLINPQTGASSKSFILAGKVDGIVKQDNQYFLLEHKTASMIDGSYLEKLWTDFQIILYSWYIEQTMGIKISGIIYNVLVKTRLQQSKGETEAEYQDRLADLIAKSKTGKSSAKRKMPETDEEFYQRLCEKYSEPGMFHREILFISRDQFTELQAELWELSQALLDARRRNVFYRNTAYCFQYNRPCSYFPLCRSGENPNLIENHYEKLPANEELKSSDNDSTPIF